jgi:5-methylcytosine-specific restriction enzyme subunit McrC
MANEQRFTLTESSLGQKLEHRRLRHLLAAVDQLNGSIAANEVPLVSLSGRSRAAELSELLSYSIDRCGYTNSWSVVESALFDVSHYIGSYSTQVGEERITLRLEPRWGQAIISYLLQYTTGIYQPPAASAAMAAQRDSAVWLLAMLWKSQCAQALRVYHLPKQYKTRRTNDRFFRGRLDVAKQIRENSVDQSRFACVDSPLTWDTTIGRTMRYVYRLLSESGAYPALMNDLSATDDRLASFGVAATAVRPEQIDAIRYTRLSEGYKPLMETSKAVIRQFGGNSQGGAQQVPSFFIDMAELWENYLLAVLKRHLPPEYRVTSPNELGGEWLLQGEKRQIRPDLLIEREGQVIAVLDAKFKNVREIGKHAQGAVSREDLYQMCTYLYHYGDQDRPILGLFVTPVSGLSSPSVETFSSTSQHRIGVVTFDIARWDEQELDREQMMPLLKEAERSFCESLAAVLRERD